MEKTILYFFSLLICTIQADAQAFAFLPKLKKYVAKQSIPPGYYNPQWLVISSEFNYDQEGKLMSCLKLQNKDTVEYTVKEYDAKARLIKSKTRRTWDGDSTITLEYNESGDLIHSHTMAQKMFTEFYIEKTGEFKNVFVDEHQIFSAEYDNNHKQIKNKTKYFSLYENDTITKSYVLAGYIGSASEEDKQIPPVMYEGKIKDSIPVIAYTDGYNEMWRPGATFEYDKEKRLIKLHYNLDGFNRFFQYEWKDNLLIHKKQLGAWGTDELEDEWEYEYLFY